MYILLRILMGFGLGFSSYMFAYLDADPRRPCATRPPPSYSA